MRRSLALVLSPILALALPPLAAAQQDTSGSQDPPTQAPAVPTEIFGPAPPVPPAVIVRDASGVTVRATRTNQPIDIDGDLDEEIYQQVQSMSDFIQNDPAEGDPATERTEVWLLYDDDNVYVVAAAGKRAPTGSSPPKCGATTSGSCGTTTSPGRSTLSTTGATSSCSR